MKKTPNPPVLNIVEVVQSARNAEFCRDIRTLQKILQSVENLHDCLSQLFTDFENPIRAELFRLYGFYLTFAGRAKNKKDFHTRAKDALTIAIELFEKENLLEKAAEAKIIMAFAYWNNGEVENAETHLDMAEMEFAGNKFHPVFLQIQVNRLMILSWSGRFQEAIDLSDAIQKNIAYCIDKKVKLIHHFESAIIFQYSSIRDKAIYHYLEAEKIARETENQHLSALNYNNFSLLHLDQRNYQKAHSYSKLSLEILEKIGHTGWIPHVLDSRANIFLGEGKFKPALSFIEKALGLFYKSDDFKGLTAALWTKCLILIRQAKTEEAFTVFGELTQIAVENIGEIAVRRYAKLLSGEIYPLRGMNYETEVPEFKKFLVKRALHAAKGKKTEAAKILGFEKHQNLSDILKKQFPNLYTELGYTERGNRSDKNLEKSARPFSKTAQDKLREEKTRKIKPSVSKIDIGNRMTSFLWNFEAEKYSTFYFNETAMKSFGINESAIVVVVPSEETLPNDRVVALDGEKFVFGKVCHDSFSNVFFLEWENDTVFLTSENIVGVPIAYQTIQKAKAEVIAFIKL